jgi:hypothetical protein
MLVPTGEDSATELIQVPVEPNECSLVVASILAFCCDRVCDTGAANSNGPIHHRRVRPLVKFNVGCRQSYTPLLRLSSQCINEMMTKSYSTHLSNRRNGVVILATAEGWSILFACHMVYFCVLRIFSDLGISK